MKALFTFCSTISCLTALRITTSQPHFEGTLPEPFGYEGLSVIQQDPMQKELFWDQDDWERNGYIVSALATFEATAALIERRDYDDKEGLISPCAISVAWGPVVPYLDAYQWRQEFRALNWKPRKPHAPQDPIVERYTTTLHIVPRSPEVLERLKDKAPGDRIHLVGYLVHIAGANDFEWHSSLSRTDHGRNAGEILWLEDIR